jgi:hypothetical protein
MAGKFMRRAAIISTVKAQIISNHNKTLKINKSMNKITHTVATAVLFASSFSCNAAPACSAEAIVQAKKLLDFDSNNDERVEIDHASVKELPSIRNPANPKQRFKVLEVWGYIYKGQYRMRFIYYNSASISCHLMGQEILEHASL